MDQLQALIQKHQHLEVEKQHLQKQLLLLELELAKHLAEEHHPTH